MKIFAFDPITGTRGKLLADGMKLASWTAQSLDYLVEAGKVYPLSYKMPKKRKDVRHTVHVDAGIYKDGEEVSYRCESWVCFCLGEWKAGESTPTWEWVILPPKSAVQYLEQA